MKSIVSVVSLRRGSFPLTLCLALCTSLAATSTSWAQERDRNIYRCPTNPQNGASPEYTNTITPAQAQARNCKLVTGGNVTVMGQTASRKANRSGTTTASATSPASAPRVDVADQRVKDSDSRTILQSELRKAEAHLAELQKTYNNGAPEKLASEVANPQKYQDRIAELKAAMGRDESDIASIRRELSRLP
ncbi:MAG: hypothetical protein RLZZ495_1126 [Pseudomonadota bacterium]|jgi:predicted lipid-binding transport protein (Tim44 family)